MTADEVADLLRLHKGTVYQLIKNGKIPYFRVGTDYRFDREAIEKWRRSQKFPDPATAPKRGSKRRNS